MPGRDLADLFAPERRDATIAALIDARGREPGAQNHLAAIQQRITEAEARLRRLASAIEAGADPTAFVDQINQATAPTRRCPPSGRTRSSRGCPHQ